MYLLEREFYVLNQRRNNLMGFDNSHIFMLRESIIKCDNPPKCKGFHLLQYVADYFIIYTLAFNNSYSQLSSIDFIDEFLNTIFKIPNLKIDEKFNAFYKKYKFDGFVCSSVVPNPWMYIIGSD
jgi:hypothetical protein